MGRIQVREHYDREVVVRVSGDVASEALPCSTVLDTFMTVLLTDTPSKSVASRIWFPTIQRIDGPNTVQAGLFEKLCAIEPTIPLGQVENIEIKRAIGSGVERGRNPLLILELAVVDLVPSSAIRDDEEICRLRPLAEESETELKKKRSKRSVKRSRAR